MQIQERPKKRWLVYFVALIALIGGVGFAFDAPILLAGRIWRGPRRLGMWLFREGVNLLMRCQPWLKADVMIEQPQGGVLYVSNHRSNLDTFFLLAHILEIRVLAKRSLLLIPFLGEAMWLTRQIFVRQGRSSDMTNVMRKIEDGLRHGDAVHVFPEYTRCQPGFVGTQKFALAPFQVAMSANALVVPIVFLGTDEVWPKGSFGLRAHRPVRVQSLTPIRAQAFANPRALMLEVKAQIDAVMKQGNL